MAEDGMDQATPPSGEGLPLDLYEAGDERFVAALRAVRDAPSLARFAATWFADPRPEARRLLFAYLAEPPNAPGHEGLVKRLFKLAESAGDDDVMARFLNLGDRLIIRRRRSSFTHRRETFRTVAEAQARRVDWEAEGYLVIEIHARGSRRIRLEAWRQITASSHRGTTLPRLNWREGEALAALTAEQIAERRWFSVATRRYLQRRIWRYFRRLGRTDPARYVRAATTALSLIDPTEITDGRSLLDRFGLMHILFGASPALGLRSTGWDLAPGQKLADLAPAPAFADAWRDHPEAILALLDNFGPPVIMRWAWREVEADLDRFRAMTYPDAWRGFITHSDPEIVRGLVRLFEGYDERTLWLASARDTWDRLPLLGDSVSRAAMVEIIGRMFTPAEASRATAVEMATHRDEALAGLGWHWVKGQGIESVPEEADRDAKLLLGLLDARCPALRPTILRRLREGLSRRPGARAVWVWAFLDHPHRDARAEGLAWLSADDALWADPGLWANLTRSPYPEIQAWVATVRPPAGFDASLAEAARAAVLLAPTGHARAKPAAIRQVVRRLEGLGIKGDDAEVDSLLGLLADLTRSALAPERRASLAALVALVERFPEWTGRVEGLVPALQLGGGSAIVPG